MHDAERGDPPADRGEPGTGGRAVSIAELLAERERIEAEAMPLREKLARRDEVLAARDRAKALHERLFEQHDRAAGDAILYRRALPPRPQELDLAKDAWEQAEDVARAAELACEGTEAALLAKNAEAGIKAGQIRDQANRDMPAACILLCEAYAASLRRAEADRARF
jgi:hypothetical protein